MICCTHSLGHGPRDTRLWHGQRRWALAEQTDEEDGSVPAQVWEHDGPTWEGQWTDCKHSTCHVGTTRLLKLSYIASMKSDMQPLIFGPMGTHIIWNFDNLVHNLMSASYLEPLWWKCINYICFFWVLPYLALCSRVYVVENLHIWILLLLCLGTQHREGGCEKLKIHVYVAVYELVILHFCGNFKNPSTIDSWLWWRSCHLGGGAAGCNRHPQWRMICELRYKEGRLSYQI